MAFCALAGEARAQNPATAVFPAAVATDNELLCWGNNFQTRLSSAIDADDASIPVWSTAGFCAPSVVKIGSELIKISAVGSGALTVASGGRGFDGTAAAAHYSSSLVNGFVPAAWFHQIAAEVKATQTALGLVGAVGDLSGDTDDVAEGAVNLYFTQARARAAISGGANVSYTEGTGVIAVNAFPYGSLSGVPATFAPSAHAASHQSGGGDVLNLAGLSVAWGDLTSVPASFAPTAHAASHGAGQSDAITIAESQISDLAHFDGAYSSLSGVPLTFAPTAHASSHQDGGADELTIAWGQLSGVPGSFAPSAHAASHGAGQSDAVTITEAQISDLAHFDGAYGSLSGVPSTFAPSAHAAAHQAGGVDVLNLAGLSVAWGDLTSVPASFAPSAHAASHGAGQSDAVTITEAQISDLAHFGGAFSDLTGAATDAQIPDTITLTSIGQAGDVDLTGIADGECLVYDGVTDNRLEPGACGGGGGSPINVEEDNVEVVAAADLTGIDFLGADFDVVNSANEADVSIAAGITRDNEWDTLAEIEAATGYDFSDASNLTDGTIPEARIGAFSSLVNIDGGFEIADARCTAVAGVVTCTDPTAGDGVSTWIFKGGAGQGAADILTVVDGSGSERLKVNISAVFMDATAHFSATTLAGARVSIGSGVTLGSTFGIKFNSGSSSGTGTADTSLFRGGAGRIDVGDGAANANGIVNAAGYQIAGGAPAGNVLRANGTSFVSAQLNYSDLAGTVPETNDLETDGADGIANTEIYIGTGAGTGNYAAISGDATLANNGALTVVDDSHAHTTTTISGLDAGDVTTGTFADARISASSVTQHIAGGLSFSQPAGADPVHHQFFVTTTVTAVNCRTDAGTVTLTIYESTAPFSGTDSTVSTINCTTSGVAGSISDATIAANSYARFVYTSEAGGVGATSTSLRFTQ